MRQHPPQRGIREKPEGCAVGAGIAPGPGTSGRRDPGPEGSHWAQLDPRVHVVPLGGSLLAPEARRTGLGWGEDLLVTGGLLMAASRWRGCSPQPWRLDGDWKWGKAVGALGRRCEGACVPR